MKYQDLTKTEDQRNQAISAFISLLTHPGWKLVEAILDDSIEMSREKLENIPEDRDETKEDIDVIRHALKLTKDLRNTPTSEIERLKKTESTEPNADPYYTVETLKKARNQ